MNKFSSLSSCSRSGKEGLLINGPYQMSDMLVQHESKERILSCEKGISLLFQYFLCFYLLCSTAKKWGGQCPPGPPVFDAPALRTYSWLFDPPPISNRNFLDIQNHREGLFMHSRDMKMITTNIFHGKSIILFKQNSIILEQGM